MRVLLIQPNSSERMVGFSAMVRPEPLALEILAASVPDHEVKILDLRVDPTLDRTMASFKPDLVGVTGYTAAVPSMLNVCARVKELAPETTTVAGGYHASLRPVDFDVPFVDTVVVGEGENTFRELVSTLETGRELADVAGLIYRHQGHQQATARRLPTTNMDDLPLPARHLVDHYRENYHFHFWENPYLLETARGCPFRCNFCAVWRFHLGKCRMRSPEVVVRDLKQVRSNIVCFVDDNFLQSVKRSERLYGLVKAEGLQAQYWIQARSDTIVRHPHIIRKWAEIGLSSALIGFEKFREEELQATNKRSSVRINEEAIRILHHYGVDIWGMFIVDPQWTEADFDALIEYVRRWKIAFPNFTILTPIPGTLFFEEKLKELTTGNYELYDFLHTVLPTRLPLEEFYANMARLYASTTLGLKELKQRIRAGRIPHSALRRGREILKDVTSPRAYLRNLERA